MKWATAVAALAVLVAACGGGTITEESFETVPPPSSTEATTEATAATGPADQPANTESTPVTTELIVVDGPPAPDFSLALDDGRGFILSDESKPVYMVFWAEW